MSEWRDGPRGVATHADIGQISNARFFLSFDVGGTNIRAAIYDAEIDALMWTETTAAPSRWTNQMSSEGQLKAMLVKTMADVWRRLRQRWRIDAIAVALPGPVDAEGNFSTLPTLFGDVPTADVTSRLREAFEGLRTVWLNDVTAAGYAVESSGDFFLVTISSGIGSKLFVAGRPMLGTNGFGGEIGHWLSDRSMNAPVCECGARGHLGAIASGRGAVNMARADAALNRSSYAGSRLANLPPDRMTAERIADAYRAGDPWATEIIKRVAAHLSQALALVHAVSGVDRMYLMGGFAAGLGSGFEALVRLGASEASWHRHSDWETGISLVRDQATLGLLGAGRCAAHSFSR